jgi:WD40 repeat protein
MLVAAAGVDGAVRLWDPESGRYRRRLGEVAVRFFDPESGRYRRRLDDSRDFASSAVTALCPAVVDRRVLLAAGDNDGTVSVWDPATSVRLWTFRGHDGAVHAIHAVSVAGRQLLVTAGQDQVIRLWGLRGGRALRVLRGHSGPVLAATPLILEGRAFIATVSEDQTARLWDLESASCAVTIPLHHPGDACAMVDEAMFIGLAVGVVAIDVSRTIAAY